MEVLETFVYIENDQSFASVQLIQLLRFVDIQLF